MAPTFFFQLSAKLFDHIVFIEHFNVWSNILNKLFPCVFQIFDQGSRWPLTQIRVLFWHLYLFFKVFRNKVNTLIFELKNLLKLKKLIFWRIIANKYKANFSIPKQPDAEYNDSCYTMAVVSEQCTYVVSRDNETLESRQDNCSIPKWASALTLRVSIKVHWRFSLEYINLAFF